VWQGKESERHVIDSFKSTDDLSQILLPQVDLDLISYIHRLKPCMHIMRLEPGQARLCRVVNVASATLLDVALNSDSNLYTVIGKTVSFHSRCLTVKGTGSPEELTAVKRVGIFFGLYHNTDITSSGRSSRWALVGPYRQCTMRKQIPVISHPQHQAMDF
jgi:hypothetical protein